MFWKCKLWTKRPLSIFTTHIRRMRKVMFSVCLSNRGREGYRLPLGPVPFWGRGTPSSLSQVLFGGGGTPGPTVPQSNLRRGYPLLLDKTKAELFPCAIIFAWCESAYQQVGMSMSYRHTRATWPDRSRTAYTSQPHQPYPPPLHCLQCNVINEDQYPR